MSSRRPSKAPVALLAAVVAWGTLAQVPGEARAAPPSTGAEDPPSQPAAAPETEPAPEAKPGPNPETTMPPGAAAPEAVPSADPASDAPDAPEAPGEPATTSAGPETTQAGGITDTGGVVGTIVDPNDPNAKAATTQLEGETLDDEAPLPAGVPERMPRLMAAGWWTMFGAVALGTTGGVFAGLAEREEDRAARTARTFDLETGARSLYVDERSDYEATIDRGNAFMWTSRGLLIGAGATLVASITLFALHAKNERGSRKDRKRARLRSVGPGSVEVAF